MTHSYNISGLTCMNCVAKATAALQRVNEITDVHVQLAPPQATLKMERHIPLNVLQGSLAGAGNFTITEMVASSEMPAEAERSWLQTYKPVILIFVYLLLISTAVEFTAPAFSIARWMQHFMAGFFIAFSFFKLLNLSGFADNYSTYDVVAKKWHAWGFIYPFIELGLGLAYLMNYSPLATNIAALIVMSLSLVGVLQTLLNKQQIRCACLGDVFNLPMSTVTVIEDGSMIVMSAIMILSIV